MQVIVEAVVRKFKERGREGQVKCVSEWMTTKRCSKCRCTEHVMDNAPGPPGKKKVHGLMRCCHCNTVWDRDVNAAINIARCGGKVRPAYLCPGTY